MSPLAVLDAQLCFIAVNGAYEAAVGRHRDALLGRDVFEVFPESVNPDDAGAGKLRTSMVAALRTGETQTMPLQRYDIEDSTTGEIVERYWSVTNTPVIDDDGVIAFVVNHPEEVTSYISERTGRVASGQSAIGSAQSRGVETALSAVLARLTHLNDLSAAMVAATSIDEIATAVMREGIMLVDAVGGSFAQVDGERIALSHQTNVDDEVTIRWSQYEMRPGGDPFSDAILTGELVLVGDPEAFVSLYPHLVDELNPDHGAWAVLPFTHDGAVVGAVGFIFGASTEMDLALRLTMSSIANIVNQSLARLLLRTEQDRAFASMSSALDPPTSRSTSQRCGRRDVSRRDTTRQRRGRLVRRDRTVERCVVDRDRRRR